MEVSLMNSIFSVLVAVLCSLYIGVVLGRRSLKKLVDAEVEKEREKIMTTVKSQQKDLATDLHKELANIRSSIINSATSYQNVVNVVSEKLAPWEEVRKELADEGKGELPLLIVESAPEESASVKSMVANVDEGADVGEEDSEFEDTADDKQQDLFDWDDKDSSMLQSSSEHANDDGAEIVASPKTVERREEELQTEAVLSEEGQSEPIREKSNIG